jgi:hypothetical protein
MSATPAPSPMTADPSPPMARAGASSDQQAAAVMTPPAKPISASSRRRGAERNHSTGNAPSPVTSHVPMAASVPCATGEREVNQAVHSLMPLPHTFTRAARGSSGIRSSRARRRCSANQPIR